MEIDDMSTVCRVSLAAALLITFSASTIGAFGPKEVRSGLDELVFISPELRVVEFSSDAERHRGSLPAMAHIDAFRAEHGGAWAFTIDEKRGVPTLISGGAMPFIPGHANDLAWAEAVSGCDENECIPRAHVESLARAFVDQYEEILGVASKDLVLDVDGTRPFGNSIYLLRFGYEVGGVPVDRASLYFRINGGNLLQVASQNIAPVTIDTTPVVDAATGWTVVQEYLGPFASASDVVSDRGTLRLIPVTPRTVDPDAFDGPLGSGFAYKLAWRYAFDRPGVIGSWEAVVDAHTGELLRFVDTNRYGRVHGGAYPGDGHTGEADRPFPFADTGLPAPNQYTDAGGLFDGDDATTTLQGKYARIFDSCGSISNSTTVGDVDFSLGPGTDCDVPPGNTGGPGNTHAARTQYYHLTAANLRAQGYLPNLNWLSNSHITVYTNQGPWCNATSGGDTLNFYLSDTGCWNLGEIPGVAIHEWGHSLDSFDGSGGMSAPVETYADWMAVLHLHDSCIGRGFYLSGNCGGYGDPCLDCTGVRDIDHTKHAGGEPWTAANYGTLWNDSGTSYYGPCGIGDHAESGISSQALWSFVNRKLTAPPHSMDLRSAWLLADRLWYGGLGSLGYDMYSCSLPNSDGCAGSHLFQVMLFVDDDGDGLANGTPHADAIYAAMADHNIACGEPTDPGNQSSSSCPTLAAPSLSAAGMNNSAELSWSAAPGATRTWIYRNDIGCDAGFTRIAEVTGSTFTDTTVVNDITYYYLVQAAGASDACVSPVSNCEATTPVPCETPAAPTGLSAVADGDYRIALSWSGGLLADTYNVYRAVGGCPQTDVELVAGGIDGTSWVDTAVSGQVDYAYVVTASDVTAGCESLRSVCASASTTGACTQAPSFGGVAEVTNPGAANCTLDIAWNEAVPHCGGPVAYNVYRSNDPVFLPGPGSVLATGITGTGFSDTEDLASGETYYYLVRAADTANGAMELNTNFVSGVPTGPVTIGAWTDDAGDDGNPKLATESPWAVVAGQGVTGAAYATGSYGNNTCGSAVTPVLPLGPSPELSFWSKYDIESGWDKGLVQISTDGGSTWERVPVNYPGNVTHDNDECDLGTGAFFNGTETVWTEFSASLAQWSGAEAQLRFVISSDGWYDGDGWWIDDISVAGTAVAGSCTAPPFFADGFETGDTGAWSRVEP
jgi:hypothetical protein